MSVVTAHKPGVPEGRMIEEMARDGFEAVARNYASDKTEPHAHDYDVCLYILEGKFRLTDVDRSTVHLFGHGDKVLVDRGTVHAE